MHQLARKIWKTALLTAILTLSFAVSAQAAETSIGVGSVTGSSLRMRAEANTASSTITYLDKGNAVAILQKLDGWYKIAYEGKTGYISADYLSEDQDGVFETYGTCNSDGVNVRSAASTDASVLFSMKKDVYVSVTGLSGGWYTVVSNGVTGYVLSDYVDLTDNDGTNVGGDAIVATAKKHLGTRYTYGGSSPSGFDCSGFTMYVFQQHGFSLPHSATSQWLSGAGTKITSTSDLQPGDLVFFCDPSRSMGKACSHAGIYIGGGQFIHSSSSSSGGVIISTLTSGYYNQYFVGGKRM